jgi:AhpD family alkylhydroperoxidase
MTPRVDVTKFLTSGMGRAMLSLSSEVEAAIERPLFELIKIRASQINGCAYCLDMHTKDARRAGETEQRIYALSAWRETPFFTDRERVALEWTAEALTRVAETHVPDDVFERVSRQFKEEEIVALTFAVVVINSWNRLAISLRPPVGSYQPAAA